jgi:hypothetical protein
MVLVERLEGFYDPQADEFVPTDVAVEIIEGFEGDDPKVLVRTLDDAAQGSGEQGSSSGTGGEASGRPDPAIAQQDTSAPRSAGLTASVWAQSSSGASIRSTTPVSPLRTPLLFPST